MTPRHDEPPQHEDDESQEQVRRLLAAAGSSSREMPEDVAARLDEVLARLAGERRTAPGETPGQTPEEPSPGETPEQPSSGEVGGVTELSSRRRPRGPRLLLAAAGLVVLALGAGVTVQAVTGGGGSHSMTSESSGAAGAAASPQDRPPDTGAEARRQTKKAPLDRRSLVAPVRIRTSSLRSDLQLIEDTGTAVPVTPRSLRWREACVHPRTSPGDAWLPVRLDGRAGVLVLRAPSGGRRTGQVFLCDSAAERPAASSTVDAR